MGTSVPLCQQARNDIYAFYAETGGKFFPAKRLRAYFNKARVEQLLKCPCPNCLSCRGYYRNTRPIDHLDDIISENNDGGAIILLSLMVSIDRPALIAFLLLNANLGPDVNFINLVTKDDRAAENRETPPLTTEKLATYWQAFTQAVPGDSHYTAGRFIREMSAFAVPAFASVSHKKFRKGTILPFIDEEAVESATGSTAKVYKFRIHPDYRNDNLHAGIQVFARKEIENSDKLQHWSEKRSLEWAQQADKDHIVQKIHTYQLDGVFNIVFPYYPKGDLERFLRRKSTQQRPIQRPETDGVWLRMWKIVRAIRNIGEMPASIEVPERNGLLASPADAVTRETIMQGIHFDLKPANILIKEDDDWLVTDFGQAYFEKPDRSSLRVSNRGGTDAYCPPEHDNLNTKYSRRYDVFSLGCVLLEVIAYAVGDAEAVLGLDVVRKTSSVYGTDSRLWRIDHSSAEPVLKHEVVQYMHKLIDSDQLSSQRSRKFFGDMLAIAWKMLTPNAENRSTAKMIEDGMKELIESNATPLPSTASGSTSLESERTSKTLGGRTYQYFHGNDPQDPLASDPMAMQIHHSDAETLKLLLQSRTSNTVVKFPFLDRRLYDFVPLHAYYKSYRNRVQSAAHFALVDRSTSRAAGHRFDVYLSVTERQDAKGPWSDAYAAQLALTGQRVWKSVRLAKFVCTQKTSVLNKVLRGRDRRVSTAPDLQYDGTYATLELWSQEAPEGVQLPKVAVTTWRLVIFSGHSMILFKLHPNWMLQTVDATGCNLVFGPTKPKEADTFLGSILSPAVTSTSLPLSSTLAARSHTRTDSGVSTPSTTVNSFIGIPLSSQALEDAETDRRFEAEKLDLTFTDGNDARAFVNLWKSAKYKSREQRHSGDGPSRPP